MANNHEIESCQNMSDIHRAAVGMLKQFINERALAQEMLRVIQAVEEAPAEMHRNSKKLTALRKELADMEDDKDKLAGTVAQAKADAKAELDRERAHLADETARLRQEHVEEEQAAATVRRQRKLEMEAEEARHVAALEAIRAQVREAKKGIPDGHEPRTIASGGSDGGVNDGGNLQRKLGRPRGGRRIHGDVQRAASEVVTGGDDQHEPKLAGIEG